MTWLRAARLALLASVAVYTMALVFGSAAPEVGFLVSLISGLSIGLAALACVVIQVGTLIAARHKPAEKPE